MDVARVSFADPWALLVGLVALLSLAVALVSARRSRRVAQRLGLVPGAARAAPATAAAVAACLALAVAAARPVLAAGERSVRADAEVVFVVDISRSMLAAASPGAPTRIEQARDAVLRLRDAVPDVPAGVAGLTDRVLPYSFSSLDRGAFAQVVARSVAVEAPPPLLGGLIVVATSFEALGELRRGFFSEGIGRRACVVLTDGESRSFRETADRRTCAFLVIRVGDAEDRIFAEDGRPETAYRSEPSAASSLAQLAAATGGRVWPLSGLNGAAAALRRAVDAGPTRTVPASDESRSLAAFPAGIALVLTGSLALGAIRPRRLRSPDAVARSRPVPR